MRETLRDVLVGDVNQIPKGEGRTFAVAGRRLALFHTRTGEIFATQAECPHRGGPLADGLVGSASVICPLHDRLFNLQTGEGLEPDCGIRVYPVTVRDDGKIWVDPGA